MSSKVIMLGGGPGNAEDLLVPMYRVFHVPQHAGQFEAMIADLPYMLGGRAVKPMAPIVWRDASGTNILPGLGVTEAAELQELAYRTAEKRRADWRDRLGFQPRETFDTRMREHMEFRMHNPTPFHNGRPQKTK